MDLFSEEELRELGLLSDEGSNESPTFSLDELVDLGVAPEAPEPVPAPAAPTQFEESAPPAPFDESVSLEYRVPRAEPEPDSVGEMDWLTDESLPLPDFDASLYRNRSPEERRQIFNRYANDPDTIGLPAFMYSDAVPPTVRGMIPTLMRRDSEGQLRFIPRPGVSLPFGTGTDVIDLVQMSGPNFFRNAARGIASGLDSAGITEDAAGVVGRNLPQFVGGAEGAVDQMFVDTIPMIASGAAVGTATFNALANAPRAMQALGTYLSSSVATDIGAPDGSAGFVIGEDALFNTVASNLSERFTGRNIVAGLDLDNPDESEKIMQERVNLILDGIATGGLVGKSAQAAVWVGKTLYDATIRRMAIPLTGRLRPSVEERYADQMLDAVINATNPRANAAQREEARNRLMSIIEENSVEIQSGIRGISVPDMNVAGGTQEIPLDTIGVLLRGLDPTDPVDSRMYAALEKLRRGNLNSARMTQTQMSAQAPQAEMNRQLEQYLDTVGGPSAAARTRTIDDASEEFAEQARTQLRGPQDEVTRLTREIDDLNDPANFLARLNDDVELVDTIERLSRATGTEISTLRSDNLVQVESQVRTALETIRTRKNEAYAAVSGGPIDVGSLFDTLMDANIDALTRSGTSLPLRPELRQIVNLLQPQWRNPQGQSVSRDMIPFDPNTATPPSGWSQESRDDVIKRAQEWFSMNPEMYNYGFFHNNIRQELSALRANLRSGPTPDVNGASVLSDIIDTIDTKMLDYVGRTDPNLVGQVAEARRIYQNDYAPFFKDGELEGYAQIYASTHAGSRTMQPVNFEGDGLDLLQRTIQDTSEGAPARVEQIRTLMQRPEAGANSEALFDYLATDILSKMITSIRAAGVQGVDAARLNELVVQEGSKIARVFPERAPLINDFITSLRRTQDDIASRQSLLESAETAFNNTRAELELSELGAFLSRSVPSSRAGDPSFVRGMETNLDGYSAFTSLFRGGDALNNVTNLMNRIDAAPEGQREILRAGVKTAYARMLSDPSKGGIITRSPLLSDESAASQARLSAALDGQSNLLAVGRLIHRDSPEVMDALQGLSEVVRADLRARSGIATPGQSPTSFNTEIMRDADRSIRWAVGALSRVGTQLRTAVSTSLERLDVTGISEIVKDNINANPQVFLEAQRRLANNPTDPELIAAYYRVITRGLVVTSSEEPVERVLVDMANSELDAARGRDETEIMLEEEAR